MIPSPPPGVRYLTTPFRHRGKRIAATMAAEAAPHIEAALSGKPVVPLTLAFRRRGFGDGCDITITIEPRIK